MTHVPLDVPVDGERLKIAPLGPRGGKREAGSKRSVRLPFGSKTINDSDKMSL